MRTSIGETDRRAIEICRKAVELRISYKKGLRTPKELRDESANMDAKLESLLASLEEVGVASSLNEYIKGCRAGRDDKLLKISRDPVSRLVGRMEGFIIRNLFRRSENKRHKKEVDEIITQIHKNFLRGIHAQLEAVDIESVAELVVMIGRWHEESKRRVACAHYRDTKGPEDARRIMTAAMTLVVALVADALLPLGIDRLIIEICGDEEDDKSRVDVGELELASMIAAERTLKGAITVLKLPMD